MQPNRGRHGLCIAPDSHRAASFAPHRSIMAAAHAAATPSADEAPSTRLAIVGVAGADVGRAEAAPATVPAVVGGEEESKEGHEDLDDAAASAAVGSESTAFAFTLQSEWRLSCEKHKETKLLLTKWGLEESLVVRKFAFSRRLDLAAAASTGNRSEMIKSLLRDLLADPVVRSAVPIGGTLRSGCMLPSTGITDVEFKELKTTQTSMEFFDRLEEDDIVVAPMWPTPEEDAAAEADDAGAGRVGAGGYVRKQFDVVVDGVTCQDHLRDVLVNPDTEHVGVSLLRLVCAGGGCSGEFVVG